MSRAEREKKAYDGNNVWEHSHRWHMRFKHVFECPNSVRNEKIFDDLIRKNIIGKKVLDIGCGPGISSRRLLSFGARYVYGIDISEKFISEAKKRGVKGRLEFSNKDIHDPIKGTFDTIFGRAILHHIEFKTVLKQLYRSNLNPSGLMIFMEPLGSNLLTKLFYAVTKSAHTLDEKPFYRQDLRWLRENFEAVEIIPINYLSYPFGILSSFIFPKADNFMMRLCDKIDCWLAKNVKFIVPNFRQAIFVIRKQERLR